MPLDVLLEQTPRKVHMQLANRAAKDFPYDLLPEYPKEWNTRRGYDVYFYQYKKYVIWGMENAVKLSVPLVADVATGKTWAQTK